MLTNLICGDSIQVLSDLQTNRGQFADLVITSPPYFGKRTYAFAGAQPETLDEYMEWMLKFIIAVKGILKPSGVFVLNIGDSYNRSEYGHTMRMGNPVEQRPHHSNITQGFRKKYNSVQESSLLLIPARVALLCTDALFSRTDSPLFVLRNDCVWNKSNPRPESVINRFTQSHESIFVMSQASTGYFCNRDGLREPAKDMSAEIALGRDGNRTKRDVFTTSVNGTSERNHPAAYPVDLVQHFVDAFCPIGGVVLDPFSGSGTTGYASAARAREYVGIDINPEFIKSSRELLTKSRHEFAQLTKG